MKQFIFASILLSTLLFTACDNKDDNKSELAEVVLNFTANYDNDPLVMFERTYNYEADMDLKMQLLQFYISDVRLLHDKDGVTEEVPVLDIGLINFGNVYNDADAAKGINTAAVSIPAGTYTGLRLGFGVSPELNATIPPDYPLGHPLSENYWEDAQSYIFFKVEGNADLEPNGEFTDKLTFHVGGNNNYRELSFQKNFTVEKNGQVTIPVVVDLKKILIASDGTYVDFRQVKQSHSNTSPAAIFMADNVPQAVSVK
ncbi:MAG: hypothetical protein KDD02_01730 [Phaeodactylibacter sp.]|nr:hypothetical protein [Phaeodactylibacter sp.]MCB9300609.1 hypothetical protein [Lewinellaceae bacterium]HQU58528.1 hypothetical protein [Saprospiraceae bacterium]